MTLEEIEQETAARINAALERSLRDFCGQTPLEECAEYHEREAARLLALHKAAVVDGDDAMAETLAESVRKHKTRATACREAHGN